MSNAKSSPTVDVIDDLLDVVGQTVSVWHKGAGAPLVVLHGDTGRGSWSPFLEALSAEFSVVVPAMPGFVPSSVPEWMRSTRDLAAMMQLVLDGVGVPRCPVVGLGFGGWIAAQMQVQSPHRFSHLVLCSPPGIKPREGEIVDRFLFWEPRYVEMGFAESANFEAAFGTPSPELLLEWEAAREMTTRVAWKPYMFDRSLPHLLAGVSEPTLVLWGERDIIVPRSCAEQYAEIIPDATLREVPGCGHRMEMERPDDLVRLVVDFICRDSGSSLHEGI